MIKTLLKLVSAIVLFYGMFWSVFTLHDKFAPAWWVYPTMFFITFVFFISILTLLSFAIEDLEKNDKLNK